MKKTIETTETYKWSASKGEWVPTDKRVVTVEEQPQTLYSWPQSTRPWWQPPYRQDIMPVTWNAEGTHFQTYSDGRGDQ